MPAPNLFLIYVTDVERATEFYSDLFDIHPVTWLLKSPPAYSSHCGAEPRMRSALPPHEPARLD